MLCHCVCFSLCNKILINLEPSSQAIRTLRGMVYHLIAISSYLANHMMTQHPPMEIPFNTNGQLISSSSAFFHI